MLRLRKLPIVVTNIWVYRTCEEEIVNLLDVGRSVTQSDIVSSERFNFEHLKVRWLRFRAALRVIILSHVDLEPEFLIAASSMGKPYVEGVSIEFSVAHCEDQVMFAVSEHDSIGVDCEKVDRVIDVKEVENVVLSSEEKEIWTTLSLTSQKQLFFKVWTRKEAIQKALGLGMFLPLSEITLELREAYPRVLKIGSSTDCATWTLKDFSFPGMAGALAVNSLSTQVEMLSLHNVVG